MKTLRNLVLVVIVALLSSCSTSVKFPVSRVVPGADITATKKQDKQKNYLIEVTALNLASADRLTPPKNNYCVWIVTDRDRFKNIGQIINKNGKKAVLKTTSPSNALEIFITAEDHPDINYPSGIEITRTTFNR